MVSEWVKANVCLKKRGFLTYNYNGILQYNSIGHDFAIDIHDIRRIIYAIIATSICSY